MVEVEKGAGPLLKRPLSLHRWLGGDFQLLYRVAGKGTDILSRKKPGDVVEVLGPLGNGFPLKQPTGPVILVAGGIGIAPVFGLAEALTKVKNRESFPLLFYGARTKEELLCLNELKSLGIDPFISTDDGTFGKKGNIVNALMKYAARQGKGIANHTLFACGPAPMLKSLSAAAVKLNLKGHIAMEQHMACGIGTCLGCVVKTIDGYRRVCREGPVFPIEDIVW
ncbi:MAG: dihydroorotate dehydrogenase electron transfer subunit [Nitrospiraceae bacterium]|nr:MAG: dihydroorotate dehydrogenase electron transfer subunit [Nitrospiraceae bacterium]